MLADWARDARAALAHGPTALVSVLAVAGSTPRAAGTRMVVARDSIHGTIGGGVLEHRAIAAARALLARPPGSWRVHDYILGRSSSGQRRADGFDIDAAGFDRTHIGDGQPPARDLACPGPLGCSRRGCAAGSMPAHASALPQCCGGRARVLLEHLDPAQAQWLEAMQPGHALIVTLGAQRSSHAGAAAVAMQTTPTLPAKGAQPMAGDTLHLPIGARMPPLYLFGAGHVGRAIAHVLHGLPFALHWFDSRADEAASAGATYCDAAALPGVLADAPADAHVLVLTHDHALDYALTRAMLARNVTFAGLIGSASKRARFLAQLRRDGIAEDALARLVCPIGQPGIIGKEPAVIAVAVAAQLLALRPPQA